MALTKMQESYWRGVGNGGQMAIEVVWDMLEDEEHEFEWDEDTLNEVKHRLRLRFEDK